MNSRHHNKKSNSEASFSLDYMTSQCNSLQHLINMQTRSSNVILTSCLSVHNTGCNCVKMFGIEETIVWVVKGISYRNAHILKISHDWLLSLKLHIWNFVCHLLHLFGMFYGLFWISMMNLCGVDSFWCWGLHKYNRAFCSSGHLHWIYTKNEQNLSVAQLIVKRF